MINIHFWGVRGSVPCAGKEYIKYGGNTSCVSIECNDEHIIFDAGTGIINLGRKFKSLDKATLFISHAHYDHVAGLPFFERIWDPSFSLSVYAGTLSPFGGVKSFFKEYLFGHPFFPVNAPSIPSKIKYVDFVPGEEEIQVSKNILVKTTMLDHPGGSAGYALYFDNKKICYITDTETENPELRRKICEFVYQADICIYDSTFSNDEKASHAGWKHSSWQDAVDIAKESKVGKVFLYHHSPTRQDTELDQIQEEAKKRFPSAVVAKEGLKITL